MKELLVFKAAWCNPCKALSEVLRTTELPVDKITTIDVDEDPSSSILHKVRGVPTLILVDNATEVKRTTGFQAPSKLIQFCTI